MRGTTVPTAITEVRVFDGAKVLPESSVTFDGDQITAVGAPRPTARRPSTAGAAPCSPA